MQPLAVLTAMLKRSCNTDFHRLWSDDISLLDSARFNAGWMHNHKQVTDVYLLGLAVKNKGRMVTFDQRIALDAVVGATAKNLEIL